MTFLNPIFIFGISLSAVPIVIHLWYKKRLKRISFSTLKFLRKSEAKRFGWLKIREIVILILRCLLITFLFLSLARPQIKSELLKTGHLASVILIIDNSYSMMYGANFDVAKKLANDVLSQYASKSEFIVLPLCSPRDDGNDTTDSFSWTNKNSAAELIRRVPVSYKSCSIKEALTTSPINKALYPIEYVYIGDGQEHNFKDFPEDLASQNEFFWLKIPSGGNAGITKVALKDPVSLALDKYALTVDINNYSSEIWRGKATLKSQEYYHENDCEINPDGKTTLEFLVPAAIERGTIVLYDDSLSPDNVYYFSKSLQRKLSILIVGNDKFLSQALRSADDKDSPFFTKSVETLGQVDLRRFDVLILNGINEISVSDVVKLENFRNQEQKSVICFLGDKTGNNLRELINQCCTVEERVSPRGYVTLDWIDHEHPIFSVFVNSSALKNIRFYHFQKIIGHKRTIAKLTGNYPLIIVNDNLAVIATQFTPHATDIVYKAAFIPLLFRLIVSTTTKSYEKEFYIGQTQHSFAKIKAPTGEFLNKGQEFLIPGFYTVDIETIGVNVMPEEGNMKILGDETANALNVQIINWAEKTVRSDLSNLLLYCALLALLLELLLLLVP